MGKARRELHGVESDEREQLAHARIDPIAGPLREARQQSDVCRPSEMREESDLLNHVTDAPSQLCRLHGVRGRPRYPHVTTARLEKRVRGLPRRGLPLVAS